MRTVSAGDAVRLYHLGEDGTAQTLMYGTLSEALSMAAAQDAATQDNLYLQTSSDVVAYLDFIEG